MLLTISTDHRPATDLGYLLHKNPASVHTRDLPFGAAHVFYPEASEQRCTAALLIEFDAVGAVRSQAKGHRRADATLDHYVNDRPYTASSLLVTALRECFGTALGGRSKERPELAATPIPLVIELPCVACPGDGTLLARLFEPLGWTVVTDHHPLDPTFPEWGDSRYWHLRLSGTVVVQRALEHLAVLLPVLDDARSHWPADEDVELLLRRGADWLAGHPERELITSRYLRRDRRLASAALARLVEADGLAEDPEAEVAHQDQEEQTIEAVAPAGTPKLNYQRIEAVLAAITASGARTVVDLGCGEGQLVRALLRRTDIDRVTGVDVSHGALRVAARRLHLDDMAPRQRQRLELIQGALTYRDRRLEGHDLAVLMEVIEHVDPERLDALERAVFVHGRPATVLVTTPNVEHNVRYDTLPAGQLRHRDHRFEWTRAEFAQWCAGVADRHGYRVELSGIGSDDAEVGAPTQMAVFAR